jgi:hypothetical protein
MMSRENLHAFFRTQQNNKNTSNNNDRNNDNDAVAFSWKVNTAAGDTGGSVP